MEEMCQKGWNVTCANVQCNPCIFARTKKNLVYIDLDNGIRAPKKHQVMVIRTNFQCVTRNTFHC